MTLNLAQRSFKVIDFGTNRKRIYIFLLFTIATVALSCTVSEIRRLIIISLFKCRKSTTFLTPLLFRLKFQIWRCSTWSRSIMLGSAESEMVRLISLEIIFAEFQPIAYDHDTSASQTDRQTDNLPWQYRALRSIAR